MIESRGDRVFKGLSHILLIGMSLLAILPMILLLTSSLTQNDALVMNGYSFFPREWSLENYQYIFTNSDKIFKAYGVSILLTAMGTVLGTSMTILMGYGLSRPDLPGRKMLMVLVVITLLFNGGLVPTYVTYTNVFHVKNTFWGLLLPGLLMNGFYVILAKSYFVTGVPGEILEAAEIDGANEFKKLHRIAIPMSVPIIATIGLFIGIGYWNDWNNGYVYISTNTDLYSIQNLLNRMQQNLQFLIQNAGSLSGAAQSASSIPQEGVRMAISILGLLPVLIAYPFVQRFFVKGITLGGVKG